MKTSPNSESANTTESELLNDLIISQLDDYYKAAPVKMGKDGKGYEDLKRTIIANLDKLYVQSSKDDFYWFDCSLKTYEATFSKRLQNLNRDYDPDASELDLLMTDYRTFDLLTRQRVLITSKYQTIGSHDYGMILEGNSGSHQSLEKFNDARKRKMNFIQEIFKKQNEKIVKDGDKFIVVDFVTIEDNLTANNAGRRLPYQIALLEQAGILKMLTEKGWKKESQYKFINELLSSNLRSVKGNYLVLNPKSSEDRFRYTSHQNLDSAQEYIDKILK